MSPSSFWAARWARVPPILPAPMSAIFLRAMLYGPFPVDAGQTLKQPPLSPPASRVPGRVPDG
jgi:hypothetical protein